VLIRIWIHSTHPLSRTAATKGSGPLLFDGGWSCSGDLRAGRGADTCARRTDREVRPRPEVCVKPPGFEEDVVVETTQRWLGRWYVGEISLRSAMHEGVVSVRGPRPLVRKLASGGGLGRLHPEPAPDLVRAG
jgi:hypothetical protein